MPKIIKRVDLTEIVIRELRYIPDNSYVDVTYQLQDAKGKTWETASQAFAIAPEPAEGEEPVETSPPPEDWTVLDANERIELTNLLDRLKAIILENAV